MRVSRFARNVRSVSLALAGLLAVTAAGCSSGGGSTSSDAGQPATHQSAGSTGGQGSSKSETVRFGYQTTGWGAPAVAAAGMNAWSGLNVNIEMTPLATGLVVRNGLLGGSLDAGVVGAPGGFIDGAAAGDLIAVGVAEYAGKSVALVTKPSITSPEQLKGKKIASQLGSGNDTSWKANVSSKIGLPSGSYTYINLKLANMTSALATGQIDAFVSVDPYNQVAVVGEYGKILTDFAKYDPSPVYLVFTSKFVQAHPAAVEQFLEGWLNVVKKFANDPAGVAELASSAFNAKGAGKDIGTITKNSLDDLILTPDFAPNTEQYLTYLVNFLQKDGKTDVKMPDWSKAIDNSFLKKAEAATGYTPPPIPVGATDWTPPTGTS